MVYEKLKFVRNRLDLSQRQLAEKLNVSKSTYARWETGEKIIPLTHLVDLCNLAKVSYDYVLGLSDNQKNQNAIFALNNKNIGQKLKQIRKQNDLTQDELAKIINTTQSVISAYENGNTTIQTAFVYDICNKFRVSADWLLN